MTDSIRQRVLSLVEEVFNRGTYDLVEECVAPDFFNHEAPDSPGREGFVATARWLRGVFPDYRAEVREIVVDDPYVVVRLIVSGTQHGEFMGMAGSGKTFSVQHIHMYRVADNMLVEHWACRDDLGQLSQLGLLPSLSS